MGNIIFWTVFALAGIVMLIYYTRTRKPFRNALIGMTTGGLGLLGAHFFGSYIGMALTLNFFNTAVALVLGIPGVILLLIFGRIL